MEEEIDLFDLLHTFWKRKFWIILAVIFGAFIGIIYTKFIVVPKYSSNVTLILSKANSASQDTSVSYYDTEEAITQSDITLNQKLISTYAEIMKSRRICDEVKSKLSLNMDYDVLKEAISVSSVKDTDVIKVTVTTKDATLSEKIATALVEVFTSEVERIYGIQNVSILDGAEIDNDPVNINYTKNVIIFALVFAVIVFGIIFLNYYFDNTIKSAETVAKITGLPVLATIPKINQTDLTTSVYSYERKGVGSARR